MSLLLPDLGAVNHQLIGATPYYSAVNPGVASLVRIPAARRIVKVALAAWKYRDIPKRRKAGKSYAAILGDFAGTRVIKMATGPVKSKVSRMHVVSSRTNHDIFRKNGMGGRTWYDSPRRESLVIVFHDANRAGPHIDVHIGRVSLVYRVKPGLYNQLRYNAQGQLTEESRKLIIAHVRTEVDAHARVAQNLDHSRNNSRASWYNGDRSATHYGAGYTRQIVLESEVDIYKAHWDGPIEMYAPALNPHRSLYLYKLYNGGGKTAPICIFGAKSANPTNLEDRLHLKMVDDQVAEMVADMATATAKYDGASCYFIINKKGTTVWSPRTSVKTGERIEYTHKVNGIASLTSDETIVGMGELLFVKDGEYVPAATVGGILNSQTVLDKDYEPEIRIYRIDKVGRTNTTNLAFWENRAIATDVAKTSKHLKVVELMDPQVAHERGYEGYVAVPEGGSVVDGYKVKWCEDADDWKIVAVEFREGEKGGVAGVVRATSLESGKNFKLGPGQMGNQELTRDMMANPDDYVGRTIKVESRRGHEGRAAKVVDFHMDK